MSSSKDKNRYTFDLKDELFDLQLFGGLQGSLRIRHQSPKEIPVARAVSIVS